MTSKELIEWRIRDLEKYIKRLKDTPPGEYTYGSLNNARKSLLLNKFLLSGILANEKGENVRPSRSELQKEKIQSEEETEPPL